MPVISPATARTYVSRLLAKLGARDRSQLVVTAYESGLVRPCRRCVRRWWRVLAADAVSAAVAESWLLTNRPLLLA